MSYTTSDVARVANSTSWAAKLLPAKRARLWKDATQTVFGEGPPNADVMFVGEQPGDREDREGRPFIGRARLLLDNALIDGGVDRKRVYVTNAVKHFKFEPRGKRTLAKSRYAGVGYFRRSRR